MEIGIKKVGFIDSDYLHDKHETYVGHDFCIAELSRPPIMYDDGRKLILEYPDDDDNTAVLTSKNNVSSEKYVAAIGFDGTALGKGLIPLYNEEADDSHFATVLKEVDHPIVSGSVAIAFDTDGAVGPVGIWIGPQSVRDRDDCVTRPIINIARLPELNTIRWYTVLDDAVEAPPKSLEFFTKCNAFTETGKLDCKLNREGETGFRLDCNGTRAFINTGMLLETGSITETFSNCMLVLGGLERNIADLMEEGNF